MTGIDELSLQDCHDQLQSRLFCLLPIELRNYIFFLTLVPYNDETRPYPTTAPYYRPNFTCVKKVDTSLLLTCRRVFLETRFVPLNNTVFAWWFNHREEGPPENRHYSLFPTTTQTKPKTHADKVILKPAQYNQVKNLHVFAPMGWLMRNSLAAKLSSPSFGPQKLTITSRALHWEHFGNPRMFGPGADEAWVRILRLPNTTEKICIEFETTEEHSDQLDSAVSRYVENWKFQRYDGAILSAKGTVPSVSRWEQQFPSQNPKTVYWYVLIASWELGNEIHSDFVGAPKD